MRKFIKIEILIGLAILSSACSTTLSLEKVGERTEKVQEIEYMTGGELQNTFSKCNISSKQKFINQLFENVKIPSGHVLFIEFHCCSSHQGQRVYYAMVINEKIYYYKQLFADMEILNIRDCTQRGTFIKEVNELSSIGQEVISIKKDLGEEMDFEKVKSMAEKYFINDSGEAYLTILNFKERDQIKIEKAIHFSRYININYFPELYDSKSN